jgi:hypothetical protein
MTACAYRHRIGLGQRVPVASGQEGSSSGLILADPRDRRQACSQALVTGRHQLTVTGQGTGQGIYRCDVMA